MKRNSPRILKRKTYTSSIRENIFNQLYEDLHLSLLEYGGIAGVNYQEQIEIAINFICDVAYRQINNINKKFIEFDLNNKLPEDKKIDLFKQFVFIIKYEHRNDVYAIYRANNTKTHKENNKTYIDKVIFEIRMPYIKPDFVEKVVLRRLIYHEITHCKEDISRRKHGAEEITYSVNNKIKYDKLSSYLLNTPPERNLDEYDLANFIYRIFVDAERNASVNELYADLISLRNIGQKIDRSNISHYIFNETESGLDYTFFKKDVLGKYIDNNNPYQIINIKKFFQDYFLKQFKTDSDFVKWFIKYSENCLRTYFKNLCKIGERYLVIEYEQENTPDALAEEINKSIGKTLNEHLQYNKDVSFKNTYTIQYKILGNHKTYTTKVSVDKILLKLL